MNYYNLIKELCESLELKINIPKDDDHKTIRRVLFETISYEINPDESCFEASIKIDGVATFVSKISYIKTEGKEKCEMETLRRLLDQTFCYGAMAAKKIVDERLNPNK